MKIEYGPQYAREDMEREMLQRGLLCNEHRQLLTNQGVDLLNACARDSSTVFDGDRRSGLRFVPRFISTPWSGSIAIDNQRRLDAFDGNWRRLGVNAIQYSILFTTRTTLRDHVDDTKSEEVLQCGIPTAVILIVTNRKDQVLVGRRQQSKSELPGSLSVPSGHIETLDSVSPPRRFRGLPLISVYAAATRELGEEMSSMDCERMSFNLLGPVLDITTGGYLVFGIHIHAYALPYCHQGQVVGTLDEWEGHMMWKSPDELIDNPEVPSTVKLFIDSIKNPDAYWRQER